MASVAVLGSSAFAQTVRNGSSTDAAGLQGIVDQYRADLGDFNAPNPGSVGSGRRQIDWDAAPDAVSAPNPFAGDFFNADFFPRARGAEFTTPGTGFQLSASTASGVGSRFGNISDIYTDLFNTFSEERLFTALGSTIIDVDFFIPGTNIPATTHGFGAVFTDVDIAGLSSIEYFDALGDSLGLFDVETGPSEDGSLSFLGVFFPDAVVASVRINLGNTALGTGVDESLGADLVVLDDFIFGEPVPTPGVLALVPAAMIAGAGRRSRRRTGE